MALRILIACGLSVIAAGFIVAAPSDPSGLVVHEWGTFLAMNGSDGSSLDGMYHEEHALPSFVHARSRDQIRFFELLRAEGRYVEPIVRRALRTTSDEQVRTLSRRLLSATSSPS